MNQQPPPSRFDLPADRRRPTVGRWTITTRNYYGWVAVRELFSDGELHYRAEFITAMTLGGELAVRSAENLLAAAAAPRRRRLWFWRIGRNPQMLQMRRVDRFEEAMRSPFATTLPPSGIPTPERIAEVVAAARAVGVAEGQRHAERMLRAAMRKAA